MQGADHSFRRDIQVLRGLAVVLVVSYHAKLGWPISGFLGVDVFFVISGFLITFQVAKNVSSGRFNILDFYFRRMKRLLPAAYATISITWLASIWLLSNTDRKSLAAQLIGALTFSSNFVLWKQSGYFDQSAELKPLLHTWSLAVEEQYYFFIPFFFLLAPRKHWLRALLFLCVGSLALCLAFQHKEAAFYLMPFRAWEMMIGSIAALLVVPQQSSWTAAPFQLCYWLVLVLVPTLPVLWGGHPGLAALIVCCATVLIILSNSQRWHENFVSRTLSKVGDFSYSLYLVHWPLFALAKNVWQPEGPLPWLWRWGLFGASFVLGYVLYVVVERPLHVTTKVSRPKMLTGVGACSVILLSVGFGCLFAEPERNAVTRARDPNPGFSMVCDNTSDHFEPRPECQTAPRSAVLVWGDSFAMHLVDGLVNVRHLDVHQATKSVCGPLLGAAVVRAQSFRGEGWARQCIAFNDSVLDWLGRADWVTKVVLASPFDQYVTTGERNLVRSRESGMMQVSSASVEEAYSRLADTVLAIRALGKEVVVVAPPPISDFDVGRCLERASLGWPVAGVARDCRIPLGDYRAFRADVIRLLTRVERELPVKVVWFDAALCDDRSCKAQINGVPVYKDRGHFSRAGVSEVMKYVNF